MSLQHCRFTASSRRALKDSIKGSGIVRKKVFNIHWIACMSIWCLATTGCILAFMIEKETVEVMPGAFAVLGILFLSLLFRPIWVEFDQKSLTIHFMFGFYQKADWTSIWKIERESMPRDIRYCNVFGDFYGRSSFFTRPKIPYSRKIRRLVTNFCGKTIQ